LLCADNFGIAWLIMVELLVVLGALVVRVFAIRPKVRGSNPAEGDGFLRAIQIRSKPSFGGEVQMSVQYRKILRHGKDLFEV
jgi:hypothetical protein